MKKSLLALAVLGAFAGAASAQSNVTIYGVFDIGLTHSKSDAANSSRLGLDSGNQSGSRLGFKGTEDLGGGLSAVFQLENGFAGDTGALGQGGRIFGRQAYVGLNGGFGSIKLGRQYIPAFLAIDSIDPFGTGNAGDATGSHFGTCLVGLGANIFCAVDVRMSNTIDYSISMGGVSAELAYGLGEAAGSTSANRQWGFSLGYANGPIVATLAHQDINNATGNSAQKATILGGSYNFGPATAHIGFDVQKNEPAGVTTLDKKSWMLGVSAPIGAGSVQATYIRSDDKTAANVDANLAAIGYRYALSKRTNLYASYGRVNVNSQQLFDLGIRHKF
jgi:predicted porin